MTITTGLACWIGLGLAFAFGWAMRALIPRTSDDVELQEVADLDPRGFFPTLHTPDLPVEYPTITQVSAHGYILHRGGKSQQKVH